MSDKSTETQNLDSEISRRDFLKIGGAIATAIGLRPKIIESLSSPEKQLQPTVKVLDVFDVDKPLDTSSIKLLQDMGVTNPTTKEGLLQAIPKDEQQAKLLMMEFYKILKGDHGINVTSVMESTANYLNPEKIFPAPNHASIVGAVEPGDVKYDEIGNPTLTVFISPEKVDQLVAESSESVINMSFELGSFELTYKLYDSKLKNPELSTQGPSKTVIGSVTTYKDYEGENITETQYNEIVRKMNETERVLLDPKDRNIGNLDAYMGENTYDNLKAMTDLVKKYPDKMFTAAGGNPIGSQKPDIREARTKLEKEGRWPDNLLIAGFQINGKDGVFDVVVPGSYGADIYVSDKDLEELGYMGASSYATPLITEIIRESIIRGAEKQLKVKQRLFNLTDEAEYWDGPNLEKYRVLNLERTKNGLAPKEQSK